MDFELMKGLVGMNTDKVIPVEANEYTSDFCKLREDFAFRFGYSNWKESSKAFKNRTMSAVIRAANTDEYMVRNVLRKVCKIIAYPCPGFDDRSTYGSFLEQILTLINIDESQCRFYMWLQILEVVANDSFRLEENFIQENFVIEVAEALKVSGINAVLCQVGTEYKFYPASERFLDAKLVIDVLNFLSKYSKAKEQFEAALNGCLAKKGERQIIDCLRLSLELFLKQLLNNKKPLEKQKEILGDYLKKRNISDEIRNMYITLLDYYVKYNNNHAKHNDDVDEIEVDFLIYLTGNFLRFIISVENKKGKV